MCVLWVLLSIDYAYPKVFYLCPDKVNLLIVGEEVAVKTVALDKNVKRVICRVSGDSIRLVKREGTPSSGYVFRFRAVKSGRSVVVEEILRHGKGGERKILYKFAVKVFSLNELDRVKISFIASDPLQFKDRLFIISGMSRGWGSPANAKTVWGRMLTRSDWIIEDETGAAFVKGVPISLREEPVTVVAKILVLPDGGWILVVHKILKK